MPNTIVKVLRDAVIFRVSPNNTDTTHALQVDLRIHWAVLDLSRRLVIPETEKFETPEFISGVATYDLPTDLLAINGIKHTFHRSLLETATPLMPLETYEWVGLSRTDTAETPTHFFWFNRQITFYPIPVFTLGALEMCFYTIYYTPEPAQTLATESIALPPTCDEAIVCGAAWRMLRDTNQFERAGSARAEYEQIVRTMPNKRGSDFLLTGGTMAARLGRSTGIGIG